MDKYRIEINSRTRRTVWHTILLASQQCARSDLHCCHTQPESSWRQSLFHAPVNLQPVEHCDPSKRQMHALPPQLGWHEGGWYFIGLWAVYLY